MTCNFEIKVEIPPKPLKKTEIKVHISLHLPKKPEIKVRIYLQPPKKPEHENPHSTSTTEGTRILRHATPLHLPRHQSPYPVPCYLNLPTSFLNLRISRLHMMIDAPLLVWKLHAGQHSWSTHQRIHQSSQGGVHKDDVRC